MKRKCDNCGKEYIADMRNIKRGWGLCCSKSCAAQKRNKSVPFNKKFGDQLPIADMDERGKYRGRTSEGYRIFGDTAYDEFGCPVYSV